MQISMKHLKSKITEQLQNTLASQKTPAFILHPKWMLMQNSQNNLVKEEQSGRTYTSWLQNILQSNGNQDSGTCIGKM